jgi:hypothetical protein
MNIKVIDDAVPKLLREQVWDYLKQQPWHIKYKNTDCIESFVPAKDGFDVPNQNPLSVNSTAMARTALAGDEKYLRAAHKPIYALWEIINSTLGNQYSITGTPEGVHLPNTVDPLPRTAFTDMERGWRVYTNVQYQENIKHSHGVHRDTPDLDDNTTATILYVANLAWYPSWFAECVYYSDRATGDQQQFQTVDADAQRRQFDLGWAQQIVSPVPGRIIAYEGRTLHTTRPAAVWATEPRVTIAFRVRLK